MGLAVVVVTTVAVNGQVLIVDNCALVGPGTWARQTCQYHWPVLTIMTFAVYLSMPGYTCECMCIPFSYCYNLWWIN